MRSFMNEARACRAARVRYSLARHAPPALCRTHSLTLATSFTFALLVCCLPTDDNFSVIYLEIEILRVDRLERKDRSDENARMQLQKLITCLMNVCNGRQKIISRFKFLLRVMATLLVLHVNKP